MYPEKVDFFPSIVHSKTIGTWQMRSIILISRHIRKNKENLYEIWLVQFNWRLVFVCIANKGHVVFCSFTDGLFMIVFLQWFSKDFIIPLVVFCFYLQTIIEKYTYKPQLEKTNRKKDNTTSIQCICGKYVNSHEIFKNGWTMCE